MNASIISIGDELIIGQVVNTNAAYIAEKMNGVGIMIDEINTIGDDEGRILEAISNSFARYDITFTTGGLGPTHDDVTRKVLCTFFKRDLVKDDVTLSNIRSFLRKRNIPWTTAAEDQAMVPRGCTVIPNHLGTAPGMMFEQNGKYLIAMPGVPYEMESMVDEFLVPYFQGKSVGRVIRHRMLKTTGIPESFLAEQLGNLDDVLQNARLAFLPMPTGVRLRITAVGYTVEGVDKTIEAVERRIREKVEKYIYGVDDDELEDVVGKLLTERNLKIAVAESCTGGLIANRITNVSGSSNYFERGVVTYSNRSKIEILGIPEELIRRFGAVSKEVAEAMAAGIRRLAKTDIGLSSTGIAGPTGGTPEKPVGLVWIGYADAGATFALQFHLGDHRLRFKERASQMALEIVRRKLINLELPQQTSDIQET
jgi:nicotinamide-nucleotide amidase